MPNHKILTVISVCLYNTQGDSSAGLKLIKSIIKSNANSNLEIAVNWLFVINYSLVDYNNYMHFIDNARMIGVNVIVTSTNMNNVSLKLIDESDMFMFFPHINKINFDNIFVNEIKKSKKTDINLGEYNIDDEDGVLKTGIGEGRLGIFIDEPLVLENIPLSSCSEKILSKIGLIDIESKIVTKQSISRYQKTNSLFFCYINTDYNRVANAKHINPIKFIEECIILSNLKKIKKIDIIIRLKSLSELSAYEQSYLPIEYITRDCKNINISRGAPNSGVESIRIINPFPIDGDTFKLLMKIAEPFMYITGDQSFSEAINLGAIICYQIMVWKQLLAHAYNTVCISELCYAKELQYFNYLLQNSVAPSDIAKFVFENEKKLLDQMENLRQLVHRKYDLAKNLVPRIRAVINDPTCFQTQFGDFVHDFNNKSHFEPLTPFTASYAKFNI